jgi:hypothetical protein
MGWDKNLHQVKQKYGKLRVYLGPSTEEMDDRVTQAEDESANICETCGKPSKIRRIDGWYKTDCDECIENSDKEDIENGNV